jgi:hypothetical protein
MDARVQYILRAPEQEPAQSFEHGGGI